MKHLAKIFGSTEKVKLMRLFLFNPDRTFEHAEVAKRTGYAVGAAKKECQHLADAGFLKKKTIYKGDATVIKWSINPEFPYADALKNLLIDETPQRNETLLKDITKAGKMKLLVIAGIFLQNPDSRLDILVVGDAVNKGVLDRTVKAIEAEFGRELRYAVFSLADFQYRWSVYDRLVRDVFEFPHQTLLDKVGFTS